MRLRRSAGCSVAATLLVAALSARQQPSFKTSIDLVRVDVTVLDRQGQPITTLGTGDFQVLVDGRPRHVVSLRLVRENEPDIELSESGNVSKREPATVAVASRTARLFVFVVDRESIASGEGAAMLDAAARYIDSLPRGDRVAIWPLPPSSSRLEFSADRKSSKRDLRRAVGTYRPPLPGTTKAITDDWRERARATFKHLDALIDGLTGVPDAKQLILITGGPVADADDDVLITALARRAATARVVVHAVQVRRPSYQARVDQMVSPDPGQRLVDQTPGTPDTLDQDQSAAFMLAGATGGVAVTPISADVGFRQVRQSLSAGYVMGVEVEGSDRDGKEHHIDVRVRGLQTGSQVRARRTFRLEQAAATIASRPAPSAAASGIPGRAENPAAAAPLPSAPSQRSPLEALLSRVGQRMTRHVSALSSIVCRERYVQRLERGVGPDYKEQTRTLDSDYLLVQLPGTTGWLPFRDVFAVNGEPVRDREDRLLDLFVHADADRLAQADLIREESSRYNIGTAGRDVNVPTFALQFVLPQLQPRFAFRLGARERVDGAEMQVIEYQEIASPTLVKGVNGVDLPVRGRFWVDPVSGAVLRARMETALKNQKRVIEVTFRADAQDGMAVPQGMEERYTGPGEWLTARATYSDIRRFQVTTTEEIKKRP